MEKPNFKKVTFLCMQQLTNFPYIEEDFDALTNYELLSKVVEYLNKVIANLNEQNESIIELYNSFNSLKNYVDNYFENLDVQDEINNKLDEMAEAGTLQEIIANYLNSKALFGFDNVASMKQATNLIDGSYARTLGYYNKNDGGNALYKIRNITNEDTIDNGSIIGLNNQELIAELIPMNNINVELFGAKGNGVDDDTEAFKKILEFNKNKGNIYTITGYNKYLISETLQLSTKCNLDINGEIIIKNNIELFNLKGYNINFYVKTLYSTSGGKAIKLESNNDIITHSNNIKIDNIRGFNTGIHLYANGREGIQYNNFNLNFIDCIDYGILLEVTNDSGSWCNQNNFYNGKINANYCIFFKEQNVSRYTGNIFMNIGLEDALIDGITLNQCTNNKFIHIRNIETTNTTGVFLRIDDVSLNNEIDFVSPCLDQYMSSSYARNDVSGGLWNSDLTTACTKFLTYRNKYIYTSPYHDLIKYVMYDTDLDLRTSNYKKFHDGFVIELGGGNSETYSIYLPEIIEILHEFYFRIGYKSENTHFKVYKSDGTLLFDDNLLPGGKVLHVVKTDRTRWQIVN